MREVQNLNQTLMAQQIRLESNRLHSAKVISRGLLLLTLILPAFIWGFKTGRVKSLKAAAQPLIKLGVTTVLPHVQKQFLMQVMNFFRKAL